MRLIVRFTRARMVDPDPTLATAERHELSYKMTCMVRYEVVLGLGIAGVSIRVSVVVFAEAFV